MAVTMNRPNIAPHPLFHDPQADGQPGLPVIDDAYYFCIQLARVAIELDREHAFAVSIQNRMAYFMAQNRLLCSVALRSISG
ncbi:MAG: hypothetical protein U0487_01655 [Patescibacteria group bacterium]